MIGVQAGVTGSGGGGGGAVDWANIAATNSTPAVNGQNAAKTVTSSGTMNISAPGSPSAGTVSYSVFKNGVNQGQLASMSVSSGDSIYFKFFLNSAVAATYFDTITISGAASDTFDVDLQLT